MTARHRLGGGSYAPALLLDRRSGHVADMTASGVIQQSGGGSLAREALDRNSRESCSASASSISPGNSLSPATRGKPRTSRRLLSRSGRPRSGRFLWRRSGRTDVAGADRRRASISASSHCVRGPAAGRQAPGATSRRLHRQHQRSCTWSRGPRYWRSGRPGVPRLRPEVARDSIGDARSSGVSPGVRAAAVST